MWMITVGCVCENSKYLRNISSDSKTVFDKFISVMDIVSKTWQIL